MQTLNVISPENYDKLIRWAGNAAEKAMLEDGESVFGPEKSYFLGGNHAFVDTIEMIEQKEGRLKTPVNTRGMQILIGTGVAYGAYYVGKKLHVKEKIQDLNLKRKLAKIAKTNG